MMNKYLLLILLFVSAPLSAETNWYRTAANTALVADWLQTQEIASNDNFYETNHILGHNPSNSDVNRYFLSYMLLTNIIGEVIPKEYSSHFYLVIAIGETAVVLNNYAIGVRIKF